MTASMLTENFGSFLTGDRFFQASYHNSEILVQRNRYARGFQKEMRQKKKLQGSRVCDQHNTFPLKNTRADPLRGTYSVHELCISMCGLKLQWQVVSQRCHRRKVGYVTFILQNTKSMRWLPVLCGLP